MLKVLTKVGRREDSRDSSAERKGQRPEHRGTMRAIFGTGSQIHNQCIWISSALITTSRSPTCEEWPVMTVEALSSVNGKTMNLQSESNSINTL